MNIKTPKFPNVQVKLIGHDGNAFAILGRCQSEARKAKVPQAEISAFLKQATSGNYDNLLRTCCEWFDCQ